MKVLYDYQIFTRQIYGGVSRYFSEIINLLNNLENIDFKIASLISNNYYLGKIGLNRYRLFPNLSFKGKRKFIEIVNQNYSRSLIKKQNFDIFHPTYYDTYFLDIIRNKPYVVTVYDLIFEKIYKDISQYDSIRKLMKESIANASHIISISNNTKKDIIEYYNIPKEKISVVHLASHFDKKHINYTKINNKISCKYFLFVGNRNGYKNFINLVLAISSLLTTDKLFLFCIGGGNPSKDEKRLLEKLNIQNNVVFYPKVSDNELMFFYSNAIAFIFPSKYEGFGIPIIEAMSCKCPVLLSNSSSFPEVAGDCALYFNPNDTNSIFKSVIKIQHSDELRKYLKNKGYIQSKKFNWESTYLRTVNIYKSLI